MCGETISVGKLVVGCNYDLKQSREREWVVEGRHLPVVELVRVDNQHAQ